jgi:DNA-binding IscR family transcriptional regulator
MKDVREATASILDSATLADMINRVRSIETGKEALNFAI